jgi:ribosomal protein L16/L10AE
MSNGLAKYPAGIGLCAWLIFGPKKKKRQKNKGIRHHKRHFSQENGVEFIGLSLMVSAKVTVRSIHRFGIGVGKSLKMNLFIY